MSNTKSEGNSGETAPCMKCTTEIPVEAERCPQCGHEPGPGILGGIVMWMSGMFASVFVTIAAVSLLLIFTGFPVIDGLTVVAFTGGIGAFFAGIVYVGYRSARRGPTEQMFGEPSEDPELEQSWERGSERGEAVADSINSFGPAIVAALPPWTWTAGIFLGITLHLSLWVATVQESEIGMGVGLLGGIIVSFAAIVSDTYRVKWTTEYSPRWWFWGILGITPLFGWIFGLLWLVRKRQKTGSFIA